MVHIDKVVLIHPDKFTDRLKHLEEVYPAILPKYEIPYALTGAEVNVPSWWRSPINAYALLENVKAVVSNIDSVTLIMEDDCSFSPDFETALPKFLEEIPDDWDLAYLGCRHRYTKLHKPIRISEHCLKLRRVVMNCAVLYNPLSKDKILDVLNPDNWINDMCGGYEYDCAYGDAIMHGKLKAYSPIKNICGQGAEDSTLRNNKANPVPFFYNNFDYIDLDGTTKHISNDTIIL